MKKTVLVVGFACLSIVAVAQSSGDKKKTAEATPVAPAREASTGMATGRTAQPAASTRDIATGKATGRVAAADVNGDGVADKTAPKPVSATGQNAAINNSHSNIKTPRDAASGQASGKRMHKPVTITAQ